jgi:CRP-like cAMP-binding protein
MMETITPEDTEQLFTILSFIAPVSLALRERFAAGLRKESQPKRHVLLKPGEVARRIYFIKSGFARAFYIDKDGREHTSWFMGADDFMISVYSFFTQQPAAEYIELLEDSVMLTLSFDQLQLIYTEHPEFNFTGRFLTEKYYIRAEERLILLRTRKPGERYGLLINSQPGILQKAPLGAIASYLGIEKETLSRVRAQKTASFDFNQKNKKTP